MLARFGLVDGLEGTPPSSRNLLLFRDLLALRRKLRDEIDPELAGGAGSAVAGMRTCIAADAALARGAAIVESVPGFGPVTAACLCAEMPELGRLDRRQAAALFGIAPFDADSGGRCSSWPLSRRSVAIPAAGPAACYQRLLARGKPHKVAVVAVMRRLVTLHTALLRQRPPPAQRRRPLDRRAAQRREFRSHGIFLRPGA